MEGTWFCWTDEEATLTMRAAASGEHELRCEVRQAASLAAWTSLTVSVNGHPLELAGRAATPPTQITALVPAALIAPGTPVELGFAR